MHSNTWLIMPEIEEFDSLFQIPRINCHSSAFLGHETYLTTYVLSTYMTVELSTYPIHNVKVV